MGELRWRCAGRDGRPEWLSVLMDTGVDRVDIRVARISGNLCMSSQDRLVSLDRPRAAALARLLAAYAQTGSLEGVARDDIA